MVSCGADNGFIRSLKSRKKRNGPANCKGTTKNHIATLRRHLFLKYKRGKVIIANANAHASGSKIMFVKKKLKNPEYVGNVQHNAKIGGSRAGYPTVKYKDIFLDNLQPLFTDQLILKNTSQKFVNINKKITF